MDEEMGYRMQKWEGLRDEQEKCEKEDGPVNI